MYAIMLFADLPCTPFLPFSRTTKLSRLMQMKKFQIGCFDMRLGLGKDEFLFSHYKNLYISSRWTPLKRSTDSRKIIKWYETTPGWDLPSWQYYTINIGAMYIYIYI